MLKQGLNHKTRHKPDGDCHLFHSQGHARLVITVGDSWSYGDCLGDMGSHAYRPSPEWNERRSLYRDPRLTHCWGRHLADAVSADWFESSTRGSCNHTIVTEAEWWCSPDAHQFLAQYDTVYLCVILTEPGRAVHHMMNTDTQLNDEPEVMLRREETVMHHRLKWIRKHKPAHMQTWFGRNMTQPYSVQHQTGVPWIDVIADEPVAQCGWLSGVASHKMAEVYLDPHVPHRLQQCWKQHFVEHTERVATVWDHLREHPLHHAGHTCHPRPQAHKMYADHVLANAGW